jgi:cell division protein FtsI (penicillin-binding protein 3)
MIGVTDEDGTGSRGRIEGFQVAGKTGTAQKVDPVTGTYSLDDTIVSFMGFVPAEKPKIAVIVVVDEPEKASFGGTIAAPVFRKIARKVLAYMKVVPNREPQINIPHQYDNFNVDAHIKLASHEVGDQENTDGAYAVRRISAKGKDAVTIPDFSGLSTREVLRMADKKDIKIDIKGSGVSFKQSIRPGSSIDNQKTCVVYFRPI